MNFKSYTDDIRYKHVDSFSYLYVNGWCYSDTDVPLTYHAFVDDMQKDLEVLRVDRRDVFSSNLSEVKHLDVGYVIRLNLEDTDFSKIRIDACAPDGETYTIVSLKKRELRQIEDTYPFEYVIDGVHAENDSFSLSGWLYTLDKSKPVLHVVDKDEYELDSSVKWLMRRDVRSVAPLDESQLCCGFMIQCEGNLQPDMKLQVTVNNQNYCLPLQEKNKTLQTFKYVLKRLNLTTIKKALTYTKKHGLHSLIEQVQNGQNSTGVRYEDWAKTHFPTTDDLQKQRETSFDYQPKISLIVAAYNTPKVFLDEMIDSVLAQTYTNWELCIADGSDNKNIQEYITRYTDPRILYRKLEGNLGISENMNRAYEMTTGDFVGLFDHDDLLIPNTLYEIVKALNTNRNLQMIYTDEDKLDSETKTLFAPHFKPDLNVDLLCSVNYICHFLVVKKSLIETIGFLNKEYDGAQDHDFVLRCIEYLDEDQIYHIPKILYHWRSHPGSTSENPESKLYAFEAGAKAIQSYYDRNHINATASIGENLGIYRTKYHLTSEPLVSIVIPNKDHIDDLDRCISSIEEKSTYKNLEYIIVENNSEQQETFDYYKKLTEENPKAHVVYWPDEFNYSAINNFGVKYAKGDYLLFLNNDTEVIAPEWIEEMLGYCMRQDVGAVGARLYYPDDTIQHAGVIVGLGGIAGHAFLNYRRNDAGYFSKIWCAQDISAVTAACIMVKAFVFKEIEGFDETLRVAFNDVDLCMKIRDKGYLIVYNPYAELYHYESKSRGMEDTPEKVERFNSEIQRFSEKWENILKNGDPYYNPNLNYEGDSYTLSEI